MRLKLLTTRPHLDKSSQGLFLVMSVIWIPILCKWPVFFYYNYYLPSIKLFKDESRTIPPLSGGLRKAALERKYGGGVSDDPEPLINYLDVSTMSVCSCVCICTMHA